MNQNQLKANLVTAYNQQAEQRNKYGIEDWKAAERAHFLDMLQKGNKQTLLEIGAGHGRDSLYFQEQGLEVTCIDLSPEMVRLSQQKGLTAFVMDMVKLGFEQDSFDAVFALNSFLHLPKNEFILTLENVRKVLRPDGLFYLAMYGGFDFEGIWEDDSYTPKRFFSFYSDESLKAILSKVFEILYFKNIYLGEDRRPFQSTILRSSASLTKK